MSSLTLLLLLCVSVHACNARCLSIIVEETGKQCHLFTKDVHKAELHKTPFQGNLVFKDLQTPEDIQVGNNEGKIHENLDGEKTVKEDQAMAFLKKEASEGNPIVHSPDDLKRLAKAEKSQARSMLESSAYDTDEAVDTKETDVVDDVVVMDYAQPHRKPPIHNEKP